MVKWIRENVQFALTGKTEGTETLVFEKDGVRFKGREALDAYEEKLEALRQRWQGDHSPDFAKAAEALHKQFGGK